MFSSAAGAFSNPLIHPETVSQSIPAVKNGGIELS